MQVLCTLILTVHLITAKTSIQSHPYIASLIYDGSFAQCTGNIITRSWILSSGKCVTERTPWKYAFRVGSSKTSSGGLVVPVERLRVHYSYNPPTGRFDFSLFELSNELEFSSTVHSIALPSQYRPVADKSVAYVTGWGSAIHNATSNEQLVSVKMQVVNQRDCYSRIGIVHGDWICAENMEPNACDGDFGGPMTVHGVLEGIVSWSYICNKHEHSITRYARVAYVRDWITDWTGA